MHFSYYKNVIRLYLIIIYKNNHVIIIDVFLLEILIMETIDVLRRTIYLKLTILYWIQNNFCNDVMTIIALGFN